MRISDCSSDVCSSDLTAVHDQTHNDTVTGISNSKLGMWVFLASDCLLFGALISTYLLLRHRSTHGLGPTDVFDIPFTSVNSCALLMRSLTMALAVASITRGDVHRNRVRLASTTQHGAVFRRSRSSEFPTSHREA